MEIADRSPLIVVVDTTEVYRAPMLDSVEWKRILARAGRGQVRLCVSLVTVREAERQFRSRSNQAATQVLAQVRELERLGIDHATFPNLLLEVTDAADRYVDYVLSKLREVGASVLELPSVSVSDLLERDLAERKPFSSDGKGLRDTILWESVREFVLSSESDDISLVLVTGNSKDFAQDGNLHPDLVADLEAVAQAKVSIVGSLAALNRLLGEQLDDQDRRPGSPSSQFQEFREAMSSGPLADQLTQATLIGVENIVNAAVRDPSEVERGGFGLDLNGLVPRSMFSSVVTAAEPDSHSLSRELEQESIDGSWSVVSEIDARLTIEGFMLKMDMAANPDDAIVVVESDWNDRTILVSHTNTARLRFRSLVVDGEITDTDFDSAIIDRRKQTMPTGVDPPIQ